MKIGNLLKARQVFLRYSKEKISAQTAYKIAKLLKFTEMEQAFYDEKLKEIIEKYALKDEGGKIKYENDNIKIKPSCVDECGKMLKELQCIEVDIDKIKIELNDISSFEISVEDMSIIEEFIKTEE